MVSIYNDDFTTPPSRPQYFIEVYRCVEADFGECYSGPFEYPVPKNVGKIEIVVPDITNKDSSNKKKFYKYVVYIITRLVNVGKLGTARGNCIKLKTVSPAYSRSKYQQKMNIFCDSLVFVL